MPTSSISTDVRGALKTSLSGVTANIYDHVPESPVVPAVVLVPDSPYFEIITIGKSLLRVKLNYTITACVAYLSNPASLDNLEKLVISILGAMPTGFELSTVEKPSITQVGSSNMLVADIRVSTYYEQTA